MTPPTAGHSVLCDEQRKRGVVLAAAEPHCLERAGTEVPAGKEVNCPPQMAQTPGIYVV